MNETISINSSLNILLSFEIVAASLIYGLGFLGNFFALIIFSSSIQFRKISTGILFLLMTISNFFHLWTLTIEFLSICGYYVYLNTFFQCRFNLFIQNLSRALSTYFSVAISIDRLIRSEIPLRARMICTRKNVLIITILIFILFSLFWSFYLLPFSYQDHITKICYYNQTAEYYFFIIKINIPLRAVLFCLIPIIIMIAANLRMINNIHQAHIRIGDLPPNQSSTHISSVTVNGIGSPRTLAIERMLLYLVLANVLTFIITQIPFHIYMVIQIYINTLDDYTHLLIYAMLLIWSSIYFGIAFYLYCLASPLFRRKFIRIIRKIIHCQILCCHFNR